jgi:hypothetical protein
MDFLNHLSPHGHYFLKLFFNSMRKKIPILILFFLVFTNTTNGAENAQVDTVLSSSGVKLSWAETIDNEWTLLYFYRGNW